MTFEIKLDTTPRGFVIGVFKDLYGWESSIQESSLATDDAIWLGCNKDASGNSLGPVDPFSGLQIGARMHLNREMVAALLPILEHFVKEGRLPLTLEARDDD